MDNNRKNVSHVRQKAKPSNSCRSAELLGNQKCLFPSQIQRPFGFSKQGLPGDDTSIELPTNTNLCMVIRKLNKKDPITKKKGLEELIQEINHVGVEELVKILPIWSKFYKSLAFDQTHNVRDLTQVVQKMLTLKCKRSMAPYLKKLIPVWLCSQFDSYVPAAITARTSFNEVFNVKSNRVQEVCLHCQLDILQHIYDNLTKNNDISISNSIHGKTYESLEVLSFFTEHTKSAILSAQSTKILSSIISLKSFWSLGTQGTIQVRTAWFEAIYNLIQNESTNDILSKYKWKIIEISFNKIDESDKMLSSAIWKLILHLQIRYNDWYEHLKYDKIELQLLRLFQNNFFNNFEVFCPKMLPFYSALISAFFSELDWHTPLEKYLTNLKTVFRSEELKAMENQYKLILVAYFDSWEFFLNKFHKNDPSEQKLAYITNLLKIVILDPIEWLLSANRPEASNNYFDATMKMIADWKSKSILSEQKDSFYKTLLGEFWESMFMLIKKFTYDTEHFPDEIINLIQYLVQVSQNSLEEISVNGQPGPNMDSGINEELKKITLKMSQCCLKNIDNNERQNCVKHIHSFIVLFPEIDFYKSITNSCDLTNSIKKFVDLISKLDGKYYPDLVEIIFKMISFLNNNDKFEFIKTNLLSIQPIEMQTRILERLLQNSSELPKQVELLLAGPEAMTLITNITRSALLKRTIDKTDWLERLLSKNDKGELIIGATAVDALLNDICECFHTEKSHKVKELCGKTLYQVISITFHHKNILPKTKTAIISKLFHILLESTVYNFLSEDTFSKISLCWETILSDDNIVTEESIFYCKNVVKQMLKKEKLTLPILNKYANLVMQFIKNVTKQVSATELIKLIADFLDLNDITIHLTQLYDDCLSLEAISGIISTRMDIKYEFLEKNLDTIMQRSLLNFYLIKQINQSEQLAVFKKGFSDNELKTLNSNLCNELLNCLTVLSAAKSVLKINLDKNLLLMLNAFVEELQEQVKSLISNDCNLTNLLEEKLLEKAMVPNISHCRSIPLLVHLYRYEKFEENAIIIFTEEMLNYFLDRDAATAALYFLQYQLPQMDQRTIPVQQMFLCAKSPSIWIKCAAMRCIVINFFKHSEINKNDRSLITQILKLVREISEKLHTEKRMLFDGNINECGYDIVTDIMEYIRLLTSILSNMPWSISSKEWDDITVGMISWTTTMLKSIKMSSNITVDLFIINICRIYIAFMKFVKAEKTSSSTLLAKKTINEWETLFAKEMSFMIFQTFFTLLQYQDNIAAEYFSLLFNEIKPAILLIDFDKVYSACQTSQCITTETVFNVLMENFSNSNITVQRSCFYMLNELTNFFVADDIKIMNNNLQLEEINKHYLKLFENFLTSYETFVDYYISQFTFKISEIDQFDVVDSHQAFSYLFMWDCIIHACVQAPLRLRSIYTTWLYEKRFFEKFLHFLVRVMPIEVLKNHDTKIITSEIFSDLSWTQINDENLILERYACHLYANILKKLPALVRKWWNTSHSRQKVFVDKLTTTFVSPLICNKELKSIAANKEYHENMQVTVHLSTREVLAVYFMDEVRAELTLKLSSNYPLGPVTADCSKNIGGRLTSHNIGMQLSLFLTHQNGTILDGLTLWKNNLDKKFEGVEECYVCYTVIHHDTCQLPKLVCKTCKKKFHGSCLYKWFTTSSKSTCPICRNVF